MFTIKVYTTNGRQKIVAAESFTILRGENDVCFEVTAHVKNDALGDTRFDIGPTGQEPNGGKWDWAFIENEHGKTVERLHPKLPVPDDKDGPSEYFLTGLAKARQGSTY